ncbi:unnamed protein product [Heterobilharzia americana]|nr:unnamed protein product [Heterobilharzia americana]
MVHCSAVWLDNDLESLKSIWMDKDTLSQNLHISATTYFLIIPNVTFSVSIEANCFLLGLPFQHGDILHVVNASDREWWQARQISLPSDFQTAISLNSSYLPDTTTTNNNNNTNDNNNNNNDSMSTQTPGLTTTTGLGENNPVTTGNSNEKNNNGITLPNTGIAGNTLRNNSLDINTKDHIPLMSITSETNNGQFDGNKKKRASSLTRNLLKCFTHRPVKNDSIGPMTVTRTGSLDGVNQKDRLPNIRSYDVVIPVKISMARPLILIGQLKDRVIDELLLQNSKFTTCILHTSRPQRPNEVNGVDYHFVTSKSIMEEDIKEGRYIEVNRFQDHYYATSLESVRSILQSGRICILDVEIDTAKYLEEIGLFPITILMKPRSLAHLRALQRRLTEDQAKRSMEQIERIEDENWRFLSAIITYDNIENLLSSVNKYVENHVGPIIWVPSALSTRAHAQCLTSPSIIDNHDQLLSTRSNNDHNYIINGSGSSRSSSVLPPASSSSFVNSTVYPIQYNNRN